MKKLLIIALILLFQAFSPDSSFGRDHKLSHYVGDSEIITSQAETEKFYWIGTYRGLYCVRKKDNRVSHMTCKNSVLTSDTITCLAVRADGETYIGTRNGIVRYDNYAFLLISTENSALKCNKITTLATTANDDIYAGTHYGGMTVFSGGRSRTFTTSNAPMSHNHVVSMELNGTDSLVATLEQGGKVGIRNRQLTRLETTK